MVQHIKANEPASLLLTLTPYKTAIHARITSDPEKDFPAFINSDILHIGDDPRTVPGYWFLHVDYKHKKDIPELSSTDLLPKVPFTESCGYKERSAHDRRILLPKTGPRRPCTGKQARDNCTRFQIRCNG